MGIRPGEKIYEELVSRAESVSTIELDNYFIILPLVTFTGNRDKYDYQDHYNAQPVADGFRYCSNENPVFDSVDTLRQKIRLYVKPSIKF